MIVYKAIINLHPQDDETPATDEVIRNTPFVLHIFEREGSLY